MTYTTLLPIEVNTRVDDDVARVRVVLTPYMGAAEYEWGAPQKTWTAIREALTLQNSTVGEYSAIHLPDDEERIIKILTALNDKKVYNKGMDIQGRDPKAPYKLWLSMKPHAIFYLNGETGTALSQWALQYAKRHYLKNNVGVKIGDEVKCLIKNRLVSCVVKGIPENDFLLTVSPGRNLRDVRVPVWCCVNLK